MTPRPTSHQKQKRAGHAWGRLAGPLVVLVVLLGLLAVRPDWHQSLHAAAPQPGHAQHPCEGVPAPVDPGCAIEMFASGLLTVAASAELVTRQSAFEEVLMILSSVVLMPFQVRRDPPGRAPPILPA